jgi:hypothetical protein
MKKTADEQGCFSWFSEKQASFTTVSSALTPES